MSITQEKLCVLGAQILKWFLFEWLGVFLLARGRQRRGAQWSPVAKQVAQTRATRTVANSSKTNWPKLSEPHKAS